MFISDVQSWSENTFGKCALGDARRTKRLVKMTASLAKSIGQSVVKSIDDESQVEGAYRLLRNAGSRFRFLIHFFQGLGRPTFVSYQRVQRKSSQN